MRCQACDAALTTRESTRRVTSTGAFLDLCDHCYSFISDVVITSTKFEDCEEPLNDKDEQHGYP